MTPKRLQCGGLGCHPTGWPAAHASLLLTIAGLPVQATDEAHRWSEWGCADSVLIYSAVTSWLSCLAGKRSPLNATWPADRMIQRFRTCRTSVPPGFDRLEHLLNAISPRSSRASSVRLPLSRAARRLSSVVASRKNGRESPAKQVKFAGLRRLVQRTCVPT